MTHAEEESSELDALVQGAFGELVPTTEAGVERAEADGVEHRGALPASLALYGDRLSAGGVSETAPKSVVSMEEARRSRELHKHARIRATLSHIGVGLVGAAAAAALLLTVRSTPRIGVGGDPPGSASTLPSATPTQIVIGDAESVCPSSCCAGSACGKASAEMVSCASGRTCISCSAADLAAGVYRFRVGGFAPADKFKKNLSAGPLEVCVRVAGSELVCGPAHTAGDPDKWASLPLPVTNGDTLGGVTIVIRFAGAKEALAEWSEPLSFNAGGLCKGYLIQPIFRTGEVLGTLSAFLVDAHYVELLRAGSVERLKEERRRFDTKLPLTVFDTERPGDGRFALVLGPFGKAHAERVRWSALEAGASATPSLGDDFVGDGLTLE